MDLFD